MERNVARIFPAKRTSIRADSAADNRSLCLPIQRRAPPYRGPGFAETRRSERFDIDVAMHQRSRDAVGQAEPRLVRMRRPALSVLRFIHQRQPPLGQPAGNAFDGRHRNGHRREAPRGSTLPASDERRAATGSTRDKALEGRYSGRNTLAIRQCPSGSGRRRKSRVRRKSGVNAGQRNTAELAFEHAVRTGDARAREIDGEDAAMRAPAALQDLRRSSRCASLPGCRRRTEPAMPEYRRSSITFRPAARIDTVHARAATGFPGTDQRARRDTAFLGGSWRSVRRRCYRRYARAPHARPREVMFGVSP